MYIRDSKGEKSVTTTVFVIGAITATIKLLLAGSTFGSVSIGTFTGVEYAACVGALGSVYTLRRSKFMNEEKKDGKNK